MKTAKPLMNKKTRLKKKVLKSRVPTEKPFSYQLSSRKTFFIFLISSICVLTITAYALLLQSWALNTLLSFFGALFLVVQIVLPALNFLFDTNNDLYSYFKRKSKPLKKLGRK